ncbi:hypothetical protein C4D60_Mb04t23610 [Musa balbisiana]|uniref:Uncharacterized protein n=1 Tax=Musa balbisiana TaxID=52838 RepID=A0A4S8KE78_MUSBA|nr:hypothetical protein C4D60_Mb04t23610 [Musa balbisiana]
MVANTIYGSSCNTLLFFMLLPSLCFTVGVLENSTRNPHDVQRVQETWLRYKFVMEWHARFSLQCIPTVSERTSWHLQQQGEDHTEHSFTTTTIAVYGVSECPVKYAPLEGTVGPPPFLSLHRSPTALSSVVCSSRSYKLPQVSITGSSSADLRHRKTPKLDTREGGLLHHQLKGVTSSTGSDGEGVTSLNEFANAVGQRGNAFGASKSEYPGNEIDGHHSIDPTSWVQRNASPPDHE